MSYFILKYFHILGGIVLLGTGTGIAFFMLMAHRTRDASFIAKTASVVVIADLVFTASAVIVQPITGYLLVLEVGHSLSDLWVVASLILYLVAGVFWIPVVWMQKRMRDLARTAAVEGHDLPAAYHRLFGWWFVFGFPGFGAVAVILWLMIAKPVAL